MKLDVQITQGSYWKGGQIPYWLYMVFVILPFTGVFGLDHLLLRSPITAVLKFLSMVPLFGFWYFYDMAQLGEKEYIMKYGIGVPFYGPLGIGAEMFTGVKDQTQSPPNVARPWTFMAYVIATCLFIAFPINKIVIGDYWGALSQTIMYFLFPLTFVAIGWGFYDAYRILFDTKGLFDNGAGRVFPASLVVGGYFNRAALGPSAPEPHDPSKDGWFKRFFSAAIEVPITVLKAEAGIVKAADSATIGVVGAAADAAKGIVTTSGNTVKDVVTTSGSAVKSVVESSAGVASGAATAATDTIGLLGKLPAIAEKITTGLSDPAVLMAAAKKSQMGGSLEGPSSFSVILLFSVGLLAFGGYTAYTLRNTFNKTKSEEKNDTPPESRAV